MDTTWVRAPLRLGWTIWTWRPSSLLYQLDFGDATRAPLAGQLQHIGWTSSVLSACPARVAASAHSPVYGGSASSASTPMKFSTSSPFSRFSGWQGTASYFPGVVASYLPVVDRLPPRKTAVISTCPGWRCVAWIVPRPSPSTSDRRRGACFSVLPSSLSGNWVGRMDHRGQCRYSYFTLHAGNVPCLVSPPFDASRVLSCSAYPPLLPPGSRALSDKRKGTVIPAKRAVHTQCPLLHFCHPLVIQPSLDHHFCHP